MNGAESLVRTLIAGEVEVCFANPGTSEIHFVSALDTIEGMRSVLCLFEGVVTGAADGYARMAGKPAATLLHLGPGLANGGANLHNAKKARTPMVNIIGDHATYHLELDAPLTADVEGIARPFSHWVKSAPSAPAVASLAAEALSVARRPPGNIASLILPANAAWEVAESPAEVALPAQAPRVSQDAVERVAKVLRKGEPTAIFMTGTAVSEAGLKAAGRVAAASGAKLLGMTSNPRLERGAGRVPLERLPYPVDQALEVLKPFKHLILVGSKSPVAFFAYPDKPGRLAPPHCEVHPLAAREDDLIGALEDLADALDAGPEGLPLQPYAPGQKPRGKVTPDSLAAAVSAVLPDNAVVIDEALTAGRGLGPLTAGAAPHSWLQIVGGSIGIGLPLALGAALGALGQKVLALQADGSAAYTFQALWSHAREGLDITTVILANRSYATLHGELRNLGLPEPGPSALSMLDLDRPTIDWVALAKGLGVPAVRTDDSEVLTKHLEAGLTGQGPSLIEVLI